MVDFPAPGFPPKHINFNGVYAVRGLIISYDVCVDQIDIRDLGVLWKLGGWTGWPFYLDFGKNMQDCATSQTGMSQSA